MTRHSLSAVLMILTAAVPMALVIPRFLLPILDRDVDFLVPTLPEG
jgi:hypothetical protein